MNDNQSIEKRKTMWEDLKPVYFPKWAWQVARRHEPQKYAKDYPIYQGRKVILT